MAIKRNRRFHTEVATSALSDIMFFLLLFFLIISTLANPNVIKVPSLPKSDANERTNKAHVTLTVTEDLRYYVDKTEVASVEEMEQLLLAETAKLNDNMVVVRIPDFLEVKELVKILDSCMRNNLKVSLATRSKNEE